MRACREMGIAASRSISDADATAHRTSLRPTSAERIGPAARRPTLPGIEAVLAAARRSGAEAIHPGYGFLSENAEFARAVEGAGLVWIGPPPETQEALGNKLAPGAPRRRRGCRSSPACGPAGWPTAGPADAGGGRLPLMLKAAAGGGGRGMRRVDDRRRAGRCGAGRAAARRSPPSATERSTSSGWSARRGTSRCSCWGTGTATWRVWASGTAACSAGTRSSSRSRRRPVVDAALRAAPVEQRARVAGTVAFHNAATVEFLVDADGEPLLPGDEHPTPGRARGHRAGDRAGPRGLADPRRRRASELRTRSSE